MTLCGCTSPPSGTGWKTTPYANPFDQAYMRPPFEYGRQRMSRGDAWVNRLPA